MSDKNVIKYEFDKWTPPAGLPPEGEKWHIRVLTRTLGVGHTIAALKGNVWIPIGDVRDRYPVEQVTPIEPYIGKLNEVTLDQVPEGEECWTKHGYAKRNGKQTLREDLAWQLSSHLPELIKVFARPNAAAALKDEAWKGWRQLEDVPPTLYAGTEFGVLCRGRLNGNDAVDVDGHVRRHTAKGISLTFNDDGTPIIYGTNPKRID